jgi:hypothetical protein
MGSKRHYRPSASRGASRDPAWTHSRSTGVCPACGKHMYASKKGAKMDARRLFPGSLMRVYQCGAYWHFTSQTTQQITKWRAYRRPEAS